MAQARTALAAGEAPSAEIHLKNLLRQQDLPEARFLLGELLVARGDFGGAEKELRRALAGGFDPWRSGFALAGLEFSTGRYGEAMTRTRGLKPRDATETAATESMKGRIALAQGRKDVAAAAFAAALAADPGAVSARLGAAALLADRDLDGALRQVGELAAREDTGADTLRLLAALESRAGRPAAAVAALERAVLLDPRDAVSRIQLAESVLADADHATAERLLEEVRRLLGPAPPTLLLEARIALAQAQTVRARDALLAALRIAPNFLPALSLSTRLALAEPAPERARSAAARMVELAPDRPQSHALLTRAMLLTGDAGAALRAVDEGLRRFPDDRELLRLGGEAGLRAGESARAAVYFARLEEAGDDRAGQLGQALAHLLGGEAESSLKELEQAAAGPAPREARLALVAAHLRERRWADALSISEREAQRAPQDPLWPNLSGAAHVGSGDSVSAMAAFERALSLDPGFFPAIANLAEIDRQAGRWAEARGRFEGLLQREPENAGAMLGLAKLARAEGLAPEAELRWLQQAVLAGREGPDAGLALADFHARQGDPAALKTLAELAKRFPGQPRLLAALGEAEARFGTPSAAVAAWKQALELEPSNGRLYLRTGEFLTARGEHAAARRYLEEAARLTPDLPAPLAALTLAQLAGGDEVAARHSARQLKHRFPDSEAARLVAAALLSHAGDYSAAAAAYRSIPGIEDRLPWALRLHDDLMAGGDDVGAGVLLESLRQRHPGEVPVLMRAGNRAVRAQAWEEAVKMYEAILALDAGNVLAMNNLAWSLHSLGRPAARSVAERACEIAPTEADVQDTCAAIQFATGDLGAADATLRRALALMPDAAFLRVRLGEVQFATGRRDEAQQQLELARAALGTRDLPTGLSARIDALARSLATGEKTDT